MWCEKPHLFFERRGERAGHSLLLSSAIFLAVFRVGDLSTTFAVTETRIVFAALADQFDLTRPPRLREERFERAVETQDREPSFLRIGLNPVAIAHARGFGRSEIHGGDAVGTSVGGGRRIALADVEGARPTRPYAQAERTIAHPRADGSQSDWNVRFGS